jgi:hypothetical protein
MIHVELPYHLRTLARVRGDIEIDLTAPVTIRALIDAIEGEYPALRGAIRDYATNDRRAFLRFFACGQDISHQSLDALLPDGVVNGDEPLMIVGAIAGG